MNELKKKLTEAFRTFISPSARTLCHSMGNPLKVTEDAIEIEDKSDTLKAILKIVTLFSYRYATVASAAALLGLGAIYQIEFI